MIKINRIKDIPKKYTGFAEDPEHGDIFYFLVDGRIVCDKKICAGEHGHSLKRTFEECQTWWTRYVPRSSYDNDITNGVAFLFKKLKHSQAATRYLAAYLLGNDNAV